MTKNAPDYLPGWILLAELAFKDKKYDEALSLLENVFGRDAENIDGRRLQSDVLLAKGDTKKAVEVLERLDQTYPDAPLIKYQLARAYLQNNNMNQAKVALDQAVSINPNYDDAALLLAQINLSTGHAEQVIEPMTRLLKKRPDLGDAALVLAGAYGSLDRFDDAAVVLQEQARLAPKDPQPADSARPDLCARPKEMTKRARHLKKLPNSRRIICFRSINSSIWTCWTSISTLRGRGYGVSSKKRQTRRPPIFLKAKSWPLKENGIQPRQSFKRRSSSIRIFPPPTICWSRLILQPTNFRRQLANCKGCSRRTPTIRRRS